MREALGRWQIFYPAVKAKATEDVLLESLEEHLSLKRLLADLLAMKPDEETFEPKFEVLRNRASHHEEQEKKLFPKVRQMFDAAVLAELGARMYALQERMTRRGDAGAVIAEQTDEATPLK